MSDFESVCSSWKWNQQRLPSGDEGHVCSLPLALCVLPSVSREQDCKRGPGWQGPGPSCPTPHTGPAGLVRGHSRHQLAGWLAHSTEMHEPLPPRSRGWSWVLGCGFTGSGVCGTGSSLVSTLCTSGRHITLKEKIFKIWDKSRARQRVLRLDTKSRIHCKQSW